MHNEKNILCIEADFAGGPVATVVVCKCPSRGVAVVDLTRNASLIEIL